MFHTLIRAGFVAGALFLQSANAPGQVNELKPHILNGRATVLTKSCPEGWRRKDDTLNCALILKVIINDFEDQGYFGRYICPPARTDYSKMFDTISDHLVARKPNWTERAVYVALDALMRKYPCPATKTSTAR